MQWSVLTGRKYGHQGANDFCRKLDLTMGGFLQHLFDESQSS